MLSFPMASVLRDLSFRTRLGRRPHTINTDSLASLHSTQLARLTLLTTFFFPFFHLFHQLPPLLAVCRGNGESDPVWLGQPSRVSRLSVDDGFLFVMSRCEDPALTYAYMLTYNTTGKRGFEACWPSIATRAHESDYQHPV